MSSFYEYGDFKTNQEKVKLSYSNYRTSMVSNYGVTVFRESTVIRNDTDMSSNICKMFI